MSAATLVPSELSGWEQPACNLPDHEQFQHQEGSKPELTELEQAILAFEHLWYRHNGAKESAVRNRFGITATRYFQILNSLLDSPTAIEHDPQLVLRLRRLRDSRNRARYPGSPVLWNGG